VAVRHVREALGLRGGAELERAAARSAKRHRELVRKRMKVACDGTDSWHASSLASRVTVTVCTSVMQATRWVPRNVCSSVADCGRGTEIVSSSGPAARTGPCPR
jgi:hypothetical protein